MTKLTCREDSTEPVNTCPVSLTGDWDIETDDRYRHSKPGMFVPASGSRNVNHGPA